MRDAIIAAIRSLQPNAYGVTIRQAVELSLGRVISYGELYVALGDLEEERLIASSLGEATPARGGRPKRYYWIVE